MEVELRPIESQINKLRDSLKEFLKNHTSPDGTVSLMKLFCDDELESHAAVFVCQELVEDFISAACLPLVVTKSQSEIRPTNLAILIQAFFNACCEVARDSSFNTEQVYEQSIALAKSQLDGKTAEDIYRLLAERLKDFR